MKKLLILVAFTTLFALSCSLPSKCELSERYTPSWTQFVLDKGFNKYEFRVSLSQTVEVYNGDCAAEKYINETRLKVTSKAPCDQIINLQVEVDLGPDSYEFVQNNLAIKSNETIDFGVIRENGPRVDFAQVEVAIFCPLCPGDEK